MILTISVCVSVASKREISTRLAKENKTSTQDVFCNVTSERQYMQWCVVSSLFATKSRIFPILRRAWGLPCFLSISVHQQIIAICFDSNFYRFASPSHLIWATVFQLTAHMWLHYWQKGCRGPPLVPADEEEAHVTQHILLAQLSLKAAKSRCLPQSVQASLS